MTGPFDGTQAVVTGASGGIGRAITLALAEAGVREVLVHYHQNRDGAEETVEMVRRLGAEAFTWSADLAQPAETVRLVDQAFERLGTIQTWINNAGADVLTGPAAELEFDDKLEQLLSVDLRGTIDVSRRVGKRMIAQQLPRPGTIVFIGWDQAPRGMEGDAGQMFGPVKAAVMAFAASFAQTVAPHLRVNTVAPGWIRTSWGQSTSEYWDRRARGQSLMDRWGRPADVARAVLYAADPQNTFLTAQTIDVNGGWNRRYDKPG